MEQPARQTDQELVIDIPINEDAPSSRSSQARTPNETDILGHENIPSNVTTSRASSFGRSGNDNARRRRSPYSSVSWITFELFLILSQIIVAVIVLSVSSNEHPHAPLFVWIVGYAAGCVATLPLIYRRYVLSRQTSEQDSGQSRQNSGSGMSGLPFSLSVSQSPESDHNSSSVSSSRRRLNHSNGTHNNPRVKALFEYLKMAIDCFFAIWFVVGNVWVFGGHTSSSDAPNLYRLSIAFLAISCIGYAMPFLLCATICCCLPCIISVMGFREDLTQMRGATTESIDALPTYKYKLKKKKDGDSTDGSETGVVAAGTEKERVISGEDAVCCICLAKYTENDELRELPCVHLFHKECVDKWLKINALCPLCKNEVGESVLSSLAEATASIRGPV
ncbi:hypothetical protein V2J09_004698 [Rumex salicifolius]